MRGIFLFGFLCACCINTNAQIKMPAELNQRIQNKRTFYELKDEVNNYYGEQKSRSVVSDPSQLRAINRQLKFWNRYFYWAEMHKTASGEIIKDMPKRSFNATRSQITRNAPISYGARSFRGPDYAPDGVGRVNRIAFHPTDASIVYAGTSVGGLWRLNWFGSLYTWTCLTNNIPELSISGIVVSHGNPNVLYILTGDGDATDGSLVNRWGYRGNSIGVLKSTDGGLTWFATAPFPDLENADYRTYTLIQDPNNANVLMAATTQGIYRTVNGGASWSRSEMGSDDKDVAYDLEYKPGSSQVVYAVYRNSFGSAGFYKSDNGGADFNQIIIANLDNVNRAAIAVSRRNANYVYMVCGPGYIANGSAANNTFNGFYLSTNSGEDFSLRTRSPDILGNITPTLVLDHQSAYDLAIAASNSNASVVMVGGLVVWKSENAGQVFDEMTDYFPSDPDDDDCIHPDVHDLAYNPLDGRLYAATDGGVSVSSDNGDNFSTLFAGLEIGQFYHFEPSNEDGLIWGGTQDCGVLLQNSGASFELYAGGDGYDVLTDKTGNNDDSYHVVNDKIFDDDITNNNITPDNETEFFPLLAMHPTNEDIMFAGYSSRLYMSLERGDNWQPRNGGSATSARWALSVCPSNASRVYCAGFKSNAENGLWRIDNVTAAVHTATKLTANLEAEGYVEGTKITGIAVNPINSFQVWLSIAGDAGIPKVMYSADAGASWEDKSGSLPDSIPATAIITDANGNVYVGTDIGVYYRNEGMNDWTPFYNGLPRVAISELKFLALFDLVSNTVVNYLYASTFGRGIWRSEVYGNCAASINVNQTLQGQKFYQAGSSISSTSTITGGVGTNVNFQSGNSISLTSGFESTPGIVFHGYLRPCNTGPLPNPRQIQFTDSLAKRKEPIPAVVESVVVTSSNATILVRTNFPGAYSLNLLDMAGTLIKEISPPHNYPSGRQQIVIPTDGLSRGIYHVTINYNGEPIHFQELIVE